MNEVVVSNFTEKHESISENFIKRIVSILTSGQVETKTYGIDTEGYCGEQESLKLSLGDKISITIQVTTKRS